MRCAPAGASSHERRTDGLVSANTDRYGKTPKGKAAHKRYWQSAKGKATAARYSKTTKAKARDARYKRSAKGRVVG